MKRYSDKIMCIVLLCFLSYPFKIVLAEDVKGYYEVSKPLVLHTLSGYGKYAQYDNAELFVDVNNRTIVFYSYGYGKKYFISFLDGTKWSESSTSIPFLEGMLNDGIFEVYTCNDSLEIYGLTSDMNLTPQPIKTINLDMNKKVFKHEKYRHLEELLPIEGHPDNFFIIGYYRESRLINPVNFISFLTSGGHHGFVERPFGMIVEQDKITGYYNTPEKLETNECSNIIDSAVDGNKVHCVSIMGIKYGYDPDRVQYSYFDLSKKQWAIPVELFRGYKKTEEINQFLSAPSLACDGKNICCTWSWLVIDTPRDSSNWPTRIKESGVYFCSGKDEAWDKPVKIADHGVQPKVVVARGGSVYVFWIEENKGLFCRHKTDGNWSSARLVIKDVMIRTKETGRPGTSTQPFGVVTDKNNNFHIIYIRDRSGVYGEGGFKPEKLIYVKLAHTQGLDGRQ